MLDVAFAGQELIDLGLVDVEAKGAKTAGDERPHQRKSDVSEPDNADFGRFVAIACSSELPIGGDVLWFARLVWSAN